MTVGNAGSARSSVTSPVIIRAFAEAQSSRDSDVLREALVDLAEDELCVFGGTSEDELLRFWLSAGEPHLDTYVCEVDGVPGIAGIYALRPSGIGRASRIARCSIAVTLPPDRGCDGETKRNVIEQLLFHSLTEAQNKGYLAMQLEPVAVDDHVAVRTFESYGFSQVFTIPGLFPQNSGGAMAAQLFVRRLDDLNSKIVRPSAESPEALQWTVGEEVRFDPHLGGGDNIFSVAPTLPEGLQLDAETGAIWGTPGEPSESATYRVTACKSVDVSLEVIESSGASMDIHEDFAAQIDSIVDIANLLAAPIKRKVKVVGSGDWMLWMVHRAYLNDPTLVELDFSNKSMPPPHVEARIAPKLMTALRRNTHIEILTLFNSNLQKMEGVRLAEALMENQTLRAVNVEANWLNSHAVREIAMAIRANGNCVIEDLRLAQKGSGEVFGRPTEEAVGLMMRENKMIARLGFECNDSHWRNVIDRALVRNGDLMRRKQQATQVEAAGEIKTLGKLMLSKAPIGRASELLPEHGPEHKMFYDYVIQNMKLPTTAQLQEFAKNNGQTFRYSQLAPLVKECRTEMLDAAVQVEVVVTDAFGVVTDGNLRCWSETNEHWCVDVWCDNGDHYAFRSRSQPSFSISNEWAEWLRSAAEAAG